jgi:hypothetical protein
MVTVGPGLPAGWTPPKWLSQIIISRPLLLLFVLRAGLYQMSYESSHAPLLTVLVSYVVVTLSGVLLIVETGTGISLFCVQ